MSPNRSKRISTDEESLASHKKNRFGRVSDEYNFRYEDQVVVPAAPSIPSTPDLGKFSPSLSLVRPTEAMREVASRASKRLVANKSRKKQAALNESDDGLEIISFSPTPPPPPPAQVSRAKSRSATSSMNGDPVSNPTPEMLLVMNKTKTRKRK